MKAEVEPARDPGISPSASVLVQSVSKVFRSSMGDITALADINLEIGEGEFISIVGPSGCGKSTLLRCIAGLLSPTSGSIELAGNPVVSPPENLALVFQRDVLLEWRSVLNNVLLPSEMADLPRRNWIDRANDLLALMGLKGYEHRYPWELSGGMRQRAALCRTLIQDPKYLLMDEPFGALDAITRDVLNLEIQRLWLDTSMTSILVTHSIVEAVFLSDRVIVLSHNPGSVLKTVNINLPRPRTLALRETPEFTRFVAELREVFEGMGVFGAKQ